MAPANHYFRFGSFRLDPRNRMLLHNGIRVQLTPRMFDVLLYLVERAGSVISHDELLDRLWANVFVTNAVLVQNIAALRRTLGRGQDRTKFIETVPKRGYRFVAPIETGEVLPTHEPRRAIAVLPFRDASPGPSHAQAANRDFLSVSIADALTLRLGRFTDITVRPVASMLGGVVEADNPTSAGRKLDVPYVVAGQFEVAGDEIVLTVGLFRVANDERIWRGRFVLTASNAIAIEKQIVKTIHERMSDTRLAPTEANAGPALTPSVLAHQEYLRGRYFWNRRGAKDIFKAIECFQRSVELDPEFGLAFSGLSDCYTQLIHFGAVHPADAIPLARDAAAKAMKLNPDCSESRASWGYILAGYDWDWLASEEEFRTAIELNANNVTVRHWLATLYVVMHQHDKALATLEGAGEIDPLSPILGSNFGMNLYFMNEFERAEEKLTAVLDLEPSFAPAALYLGRVYQALERYSRAVDQFAAAHKAFQSSSIKAELAQALILAGRQTESDALQGELLACKENEYVSPYALAFIYEAKGDRRVVQELLNEAFEERSINMMWFAVEPRFAAVRETAFGQGLLERANHVPIAKTGGAERLMKSPA